MLNYFKLAFVLVRTWAAIWLGLAIMGLAWSSATYLRLESIVPFILSSLAGPIWYLLAGSTLLLFSRPIARVLSAGLD